MSPNETKWCTSCKVRHQRAAFGLDQTRGDGLRVACRESRKTPRRTVLERFMAKTVRHSSGCLLWTGSTYSSGYGSFWFEGRIQGAHRVAFMLAAGPIPEDACVLHKCDVRPCVERDHLFLGDRADNSADMDQKGRRASQPGEKNGRAKLTAAQVEEIRSLRGSVSQRQLAQRYGVSKALIRKIHRRQLWVGGAHRYPGVRHLPVLREYPGLVTV